MIAADVREAILVESTERSGVPLRITDPVVLARVAAIVAPSSTAAVA